MAEGIEIQSLQNFLEEKLGMKAKKTIDIMSTPNGKSLKNQKILSDECFLFFSKRDYSHQQIDNLIDLFLNDLWEVREEIPTKDPNHLAKILTKPKYHDLDFGAIISRYTDINLDKSGYSVTLKILTNQTDLDARAETTRIINSI